MVIIFFGIIGVMALVISILNWFEIHPQEISGLTKKLSRKYLDIGTSKRFWLVHDIAMSAFLWGTYVYLLLRFQGSETVSNFLKYTLIILISCSVVVYTVSVVYKYFKGYYKG